MPQSTHFVRDWSQSVRFLTRVPWPAPRAHAARSLAESLWLAPAVGCLVGAMGAAGYGALLAVGHSSWMAAVAALALIAWITRGLHEDGLADSFDAFGGRDQKTRLQILRDSRLGTFGALALLLVLLIRLIGLASLPGALTDAAVAIVSVAVSTRLSFCWMLLWLRPARRDGMGHYAGQMPLSGVLVALLLTFVLVLLLCGAAAAVLHVVTVTLISALWALVAQWRFGGHTGDLLGAGQQLTEAALWLLLPVWLASQA